MSLYEDLKRYTYWLSQIICAAWVVFWMIGITPLGRDDSDPGRWGARSNLAPRTDSLTGCQYLETARGGLTPRLDRDGKHVGCR